MKKDYIIKGLLISSLLCNVVALKHLKNTCGTLKIDLSNSEKDIYRLEINDLDSLKNKKRIILKIDSDAKLSQK